ncbi:MAG: hypothetical protein AB1921_01735 [Thermodesulfobacteriota bacterium]
MIYVERKIDFEFANKLFELALRLEGSKIAFWPSPPVYSTFSITDFIRKLICRLLIRNDALSNFLHTLSPFTAGQEELEVVTKFGDDQDQYKMASFYNVNNNILKLIEANFDLIEKKIDSISFYKEGQKDWFLCMIFHETMSILKIPTTEFHCLKEMGIPYSLKPPEWW